MNLEEPINFTRTFAHRYEILSAVYILAWRRNACYVEALEKE